MAKPTPNDNQKKLSPAVLGIGGVPASGKSTLMRDIIQFLLSDEGGATMSDMAYKTLKGLVFTFDDHASQILILGKYAEGDMFGGTDRLSMAVQPHFTEFLQGVSDVLPQVAVILFEGDRLFNGKTLQYVTSNFATYLFPVLTVTEEIEAARHEMRGDTQSETWLQGRRTKLENLLNAYPDDLWVCENHNEEDRERIGVIIVDYLCAWMDAATWGGQ